MAKKLNPVDSFRRIALGLIDAVKQEAEFLRSHASVFEPSAGAWGGCLAFPP